MRDERWEIQRGGGYEKGNWGQGEGKRERRDREE